MLCFLLLPLLEEHLLPFLNLTGLTPPPPRPSPVPSSEPWVPPPHGGDPSRHTSAGGPASRGFSPAV